jgi:anti-anti-sigma regulatory factor/PAS domain-containing protein
MGTSHESPTSFSIHPDVLLSALDDGTALVDKRGRVRATNPRMERLFASDDTARRIPFTEEGGQWRLGPSSRLSEHLREVMSGIEDVIAGARERFEADLGADGGILLAIACSIEQRRGALVRIRLRTMEEEHRARCVEVVEAMQLGLFVYRLENEKDDGSLRCIYSNPAVEINTGRPRDHFVGKLLDEITPDARKHGLLQQFVNVVIEKQTKNLEHVSTHPQTGKTTHLAMRVFPLSGQCVGMIFENITSQVEAQDALRREMALKEAQSALMELVRQLSTPLLPIAEGVLVAPLVGQMDEGRGEHFIEVLLAGIQQHAAKVVLIDVTGVPSIDASVAEKLLRAARAARLLGTRTALVGITSEVARTMVELGFDATGLETYADLRAGMRAAQRRRI